MYPQTLWWPLQSGREWHVTHWHVIDWHVIDWHVIHWHVIRFQISNLAADQVHGCDVRRMNTVPGFTFRVCASNGDLPYDAGSVDVVVCR